MTGVLVDWCGLVDWSGKMTGVLVDWCGYLTDVLS